ncbi:MAG: hypothetical protein HY275_10445 [Gemmatimonadetes bacterium]|nr:hypothetical protein [Gemmatimonadota bacterium]
MRGAVHLVLAFGVALPAVSQDTTTAAPRETPVACVGQPIRRIVMRGGYPISSGELERLPAVNRIQQRIHTPTRPEVVRAFVLLREGEPCDERRRAESERLLRAQPYIAQARVQPMDAGDGGVVLDVSVVDEFAWGARLDLRSSSSYVRRFSLGNTNIAGSGVTLAGGFGAGGAYRDEYNVRASSFVFDGQPFFVNANASRRTMGGEWGIEAGVPFLTDFQRVAWRVGIGQTDAYLPFARPDTDAVSLGLRRLNAEVGVVTRFGTPGSLFLVGMGLSRELAEPSTQPMLLRGAGPLPDTTSTILNRYRTLDARRLDFLLGVRRLRFTRTSGFEVLEGTEDVGLGFQSGLVLSRGLTELGATERDVLLSGDAYYGRGDAFHFFRIDARGQARRSDVTSVWDAVLWDVAATAYWRVGLTRTLVVSGIWTGGYRSLVPLQLTMGDEIGGVRGFRDSRQAGGDRLVLRVEDRWYLGRLFSLASAGFAPFMDIGVIGARDAPFGADSRPAMSVGMSLLGAAPPASRRLWRLDVTYRLTGDGRAPLWTIGTSSRDGSRFAFQEPQDLERSRARAVSPARYSWP